MSRSPSSHEPRAASAALALARRGWPVLPLHGKVPRLHNGLHGASTDPHAITNWFRLWPSANTGVLTGNGLVVLDVDGDEGADSLHELERQHGALPRTVSVCTGGGGAHCYFASSTPVANSAGKLGPGLDVRGDGGYVVAPPSVHPDTGTPYEWDNHPDDVATAEIPDWILRRIRLMPGAPKRTPANEWLSLLRCIPEGRRNDSLARVCGHLLARGVDEHITLELLLAVNRTRCQPPLNDREVVAVAESILRRHLRKAAA